MRRVLSFFAALLSIFSGGSFKDFCLEICLTRLIFLSRGVTGVVGWGCRGDKGWVCWGDSSSASNCVDRCRSRWSRRTCLRPLSAAVSVTMLISSSARMSSSSMASTISSSSPTTVCRSEYYTHVCTYNMSIQMCRQS